MKKILAFSIIIIVFVLFIYFAFADLFVKPFQNQKISVEADQSFDEKFAETTLESPSAVKTEPTKKPEAGFFGSILKNVSETVTGKTTVNDVEIKTTLDHDIPFAPQAPFGNWDLPYQEACEEASTIMVARYLGKLPMSNEIMEEEIQRLVAWQKQRFGFYEDTDAKNTQIILKEYFHLSSSIVTDVTIESMKIALNDGNLIIVPASGRGLKNPYFSGNDPFYHMLIIRGYDRDEFITNDPGTKRGKGYHYGYQTLLDAIHDWTGSKETIEEGKKAMIVIPMDQTNGR
ncbi:MAG: C39 family peptidase [Parcubacteria group bacterium]|nr:C39 family peptidase [Parcubacteria group bacterium]